MTLRQKRDTIQALKDGKEDLYDLVGRIHGYQHNPEQYDWDDNHEQLLQVLRDFINGKFKLIGKSK